MKYNRKFEDTKLSLTNWEQLEKIKANPVVKSTIVDIASRVPVIGTLIDSSIDACLTKFQDQKRLKLIKIILSDSERITTEMVNDVEFIFNFGRTLEAVNRLATNDKVEYFANLLKNGYFTEDKIKNDEFEEYLQLLNDLSYREIHILLTYSDKFSHIPQEETFGGFLDKPLFVSYKEDMIQKFNISENELANILLRLQNKGLCYVFQGNKLTEDHGEYTSMTSDYFKNFAKRIVGGQDE